LSQKALLVCPVCRQAGNDGKYRITGGKLDKAERKGVFLSLLISVSLKEQKVQQNVS
jgi:hypothetical protein